MMEWKLGDKAKKKQRILLVDDEELNRKLCERILIREGFSVFEAENGKEAVELMAKSPSGHFDLIVMDIQMPEMNGLDATRAIRKLSDKWASNIPIIAMTSDAFSENVMECLSAGMNGQIAKPIDIKLVIKEIRRIKEELKK